MSPFVFTPSFRLGHRMGLLTLSFVLCACGSFETKTSPPSTDPTTPAKWKAARSTPELDTASLAQWWTKLHDPVLNQLISGALVSSPDVRTALSRIDEARARRRLESAALFPSLHVGGSAQTQKSRNHKTKVSSSGEFYSTALDASWQVDLFGKQKQNVKAAAADLVQTEENYYSAQVFLAAEVAQTYVILRQAKAQLALKERTIATRGETAQIAHWREQAGVSSGLDSLQADSTLEQDRASLPTLRQTISQTQNELALLCGLVPGTLDIPLKVARPIPRPTSRLAIGIPAQTLQQRPDVRAAMRGVEAAAARTKAAERERLPSLDLRGSLSLEALRAGSLFSPETVAANLIGSLSAPIFDAGRISQNIAIQDAQTKQALINYELSVLTALKEVENALIAIRRLSERLETLGRAVKAAQQASLLATQQYQAGQVSLVEVLEAQRTLFSVQEQQVTTTADQTTAHIQLYKALGGGWPGN